VTSAGRRKEIEAFVLERRWKERREVSYSQINLREIVRETKTFASKGGRRKRASYFFHRKRKEERGFPRLGGKQIKSRIEVSRAERGNVAQKRQVS